MAVIDKDVDGAAIDMAAAEDDLAGRLAQVEQRVAENVVSIGALERANEELRHENAYLRRVVEVFRVAGQLMNLTGILTPEAAPHAGD